MSETITGNDNTANYNQNESIKYDENKTVFNDHKIVENVHATTKLLQPQTAPPTTTIIMLDEPTTNNDNINYKEYDSSDSYDEFDDYMNDHDDGDDDDDDDDDEDNNQNDTMENNADDHQDDEDDDDDDQDYSFIDDMLEENVDVEAIKRSDEMKPNEPIRNNHRQYKKLKRKFPQKKFTNRLNKKSNKKRKSRIETKEKNILVKRGHDLFEILPEGWVEISHFSGMPIYLDKRNRVCTLSKPYHLGTGSARKHHIPLSAIPCLQYRTELEKERKAREELELKLNNTDNNNNNDTNDNNNGNDSNKCDDNENTICNNAEIQNNNDNDNTNSNSNDNENNNNNQTIQQSQPKLQQSIAKVETLIENKKERSLDANKIREYCQRLFEFKTVTVKKFTNWADRRKHEQSKKLAQRPSLPESTKLITCTVPKIANVDGQDNDQSTCVKPFKKEFIMNPVGKSDICILHEYVQHTERTQPKYVFQELENVSKPYCAIVYINEMEYGKGYGSSKKEAKTEAARASLDILIPDLKNTLNQEQNKNETLNDLKFFDEISIDDQRVSELCWKTGQYSPYQILVECIKRLHGFEEMDIKTETRIVKHQKIEFKMTAGTHEAVVICKNKREGKQLAAQKILRSIHPQFKCWGALLKLYGQGSCKTSKEKKEEAQKITELQNNACSNKPNYAILNKLKEEMLKLHDENGKQEQQQLRSSLPAILNATIVGQQQQQQQQQAEKHRQPYHHNHHYRKNNKYNYINNYKIVRKNNYQKKS